MTDWTPPNPQYPPPKAGEPPLHAAARIGDHARIRQLVVDGEDLHAGFDLALDPGGRPMVATPLMVAAGSGDGASLETVALLLSLGADPTMDLGAGPAARFAAGGLGWNYRPGGDAARLRAVLFSGLAIDAPDRRGVTLLAEAANAGDAERVRVLLDAGASPDPPVAVREPLESADGDVPFKVPFGFVVPLFGAASEAGAACVEALLRAGANPRAIDGQRRNAMFYARDEATVRVLLAAGLSLETRDTYGWTPLDAAVTDGDVAAARIYLAAGADVDATHDRGFSVFMSSVASMTRSREMMQLLIDAGADPHALTELGWNAAHAAIDVNGEANEESSVRETFGFLAALGVDLRHLDKHGVSPLERAERCGSDVTVTVLHELLARGGASGDQLS